MIVIRLVFILGLGVLTASKVARAAEDSCRAPQGFRAVDLSREMPPIRDQDSIGWCYAYGTADQLTHWLHRKGRIRRVSREGAVSASALGFQYNSRSRIQALAGLASRVQIFRNIDRDLREAQAHMTAVTRRQTEFIDTWVARDPGRAQRLAEAFQGQPRAMGLMMLQAEVTLNPIGRASDRNRPDRPPNSADDEESELVSEASRRLSGLAAELQRDPAFRALDAEWLQAVGRSQALLGLRLGARPIREAEGGDPDALLAMIADGGYCTEREVPSDDFLGSEAHARISSELGVQRLGIGDILSASIYPYFENPTDENLCRAARHAGLLFPRMALPQIEGVLRRYADQDPLDQFVRASCRPSRLPSPGPMVERREYGEDPEGTMALIDRQLDSGGIAGITYDPQVLQRADQALDTTAAERGLHYSVLVGKRWNCERGEAEYILRNSWGRESCQRDYDGFRRFPAGDARLAAISRRESECERGCWPTGIGTRPSLFGGGIGYPRPQPSPSEAAPPDPAHMRAMRDRQVACEQACRAQKTSSWVEVNRPAIRCEGGNYVIPGSQLRKGMVNAVVVK